MAGITTVSMAIMQRWFLLFRTIFVALLVFSQFFLGILASKSRRWTTVPLPFGRLVSSAHLLVNAVCFFIAMYSAYEFESVAVFVITAALHVLGRRCCVIGLTGSMATGKSTVKTLLLQAGMAVIDADIVAREILEVGRPAYTELLAVFGPGILNSETPCIDRARLRETAFAEDEKRKLLNRITHKHIIRSIILEIVKLRIIRWKSHVVLEAPLLFETWLHLMCSSVIVVHCDAATQLRRLTQRDPSSTKDTLLRMIQAQMSSEEKSKRADFVFDNSGTVEQLDEQVLRYLKDECHLGQSIKRLKQN
eukprot:GHVT01023887.1.p1 GENE.GHVT01023887.1~~GHVT01023887.1.p1  ORF type:complete len:307 (-),score=19.48 GHVT01023887.1:4065-4985(-)